MLSYRFNRKLNNIYLFMYILFLMSIFFGDYDWGGFISNLPLRIVSIVSIVINIIIFYLYSENRKAILGTFLIIVFLIMILFTLFVAPIIPLQFVVIIFFILNIRLISFITFIKVDFFTRLSFSFLLFLLYLLHLDPNNSNEAEIISHDGNSFRQSLGFGSPNELGLAILMLFISGFLFSKLLNRMKYFILFISFIILYIFISKYSDSRVFEVNGLLILLILLFKNKNIFYYIFAHSSLLFLLFSIFISFYVVSFLNVRSFLFNYLNGLFSGRLGDQVTIMNQYPPKLVGYSNILLSNGHSLNIDNMYFSLLMRFGFIGLITYESFCFSIYYISTKIYNKSIDFLLILLSLISLSAGFSSNLMSIFLMAWSFFDYEKSHTNKF